MKRLTAAALVAACLAVPATNAEASGTCPQYEPLFRRYGLPASTFSRIAWRESRCQPGVRSSTRDTGLLQINDVNHPWLSRTLGVRVDQAWLRVPANNVRAAAALCNLWRRAVGNCLHPWAVTA